MAKCQVYFGGLQKEAMKDILNALGVEKGDLQIKYLGVPLSTKRLTVMQCEPLVEKITA